MLVACKDEASTGETQQTVFRPRLPPLLPARHPSPQIPVQQGSPKSLVAPPRLRRACAGDDCPVESQQRRVGAGSLLPAPR